MKWILLAIVVCSGCASTKLSITRVHGEPVISVEFFNKGERTCVVTQGSR